MKFLRAFYNLKIGKYLKLLPNNLRSSFPQNMELTDLKPPTTVKNMTILDRSAFSKETWVPSLILHQNHINVVLKKVKKHLLKMRRLDSVLVSEQNEELRQILLNPLSIKSEGDLKDIGIDMQDIQGNFEMRKIALTYENFKCEHILEAVLPEGEQGSSGYSQIGHILHLNLRDHLLPYKYLIGQVYLDKIPNALLVVNKTDIIDNSDNTFRSFSMEKLAGETEETVVSVKENNCTFKFDFSKVYWNPRLSTEHARIVSKLRRYDILFDVMAGVGPFAVQAAKIGCNVYANDLNPMSFEALRENCSLNKVGDAVDCFNMDGNQFIKDIFRKKLIELDENNFEGNIHVTMNLPSIAVQFLSSFKDIFTKENIPGFIFNESQNISKLPLIHVYMFSFVETKEYAIHAVASQLGFCHKVIKIPEESKSVDSSLLKNNIKQSFLQYLSEVVFIRKVSPTKLMFRVSFHLPSEVVLKEIDEQPLKKLKV